MIRFLHTGDWQLGLRRYYFEPEAQARFAQARLDAVEAICRLAEERACQFVVVCGDVFESNRVDRRTVVQALEAMSSSVPVYLLPGNHDPLVTASVYRSATFAQHRPANVRLLEGVVALEEGAELVGFAWQAKKPGGDPLAAAYELAPKAGAPRVVAGHGQVDLEHPKPSRPDLIRMERVERALAEGRFGYLALGDRHSATEVGQSGRVYYAGSPEATDFTERRPGFVLEVELGPESCTVREHAVGHWRFLEHGAELSGEASVGELDAWLGAVEDKRSAVVRLTLAGQVALRGGVRLDEVLSHHGDLFAALDVRRDALVVVPDRIDRDSLSLAGFAAVTLDRLLERAERSGEEAAEARAALELLYRLAREGE